MSRLEPYIESHLSQLGLSELPSSERDLKRAYAKKLKTIDQALDPNSFQNLQDAFEALKNITANGEAYKLNHSPVKSDTRTSFQAEPSTQTSQETLSEATPEQEAFQPASIRELEGEADDLLIISDAIMNAAQLDNSTLSCLEQEIFDYLHRCSLDTTQTDTHFKPYVTGEFLQQLDRVFGWYSDFKSMKGLTGDTQGLQRALFNSKRSERPPKQPFWQKPENNIAILLFVFCFSVLLMSLPEIWWQNDTSGSIKNFSFFCLVPYVLWSFSQTFRAGYLWLKKQFERTKIPTPKRETSIYSYLPKLSVRLIWLAVLTYVASPKEWQLAHVKLWLGTAVLIVVFRSPQIRSKLKALYAQD